MHFIESKKKVNSNSVKLGIVSALIVPVSLALSTVPDIWCLLNKYLLSE